MSYNHIFSNELTYQHCINDNGTVSNSEGTSMPRDRQTPSETATFISCTFTRLNSTLSGGAISFSCEGSLTINQCLFSSCTSTIGHTDTNGGGAVYMSSGTLSVLSSIFPVLVQQTEEEYSH